MNQQQILISGVGGQGVLFVTRLLAEAAIEKNLPVLTAETHGMAQRGGSVISHLKVGDFISPMIRPGNADLLIALKAENLESHGAYLKPAGRMVVNSGKEAAHAEHKEGRQVFLPAEKAAEAIGNLKSVNLILLGYAAAQNALFCTFEEIRSVLESRFSKNPKLLKASVQAIEAGADLF